MAETDPIESLAVDSPASDRAALLIAAGASAVAFGVGFNYGAFDSVFFDQIFTVWVVSTILFGASIVTKLPPRTWPRRLVLLLPTFWLIVAWINNNTEADNAEAILSGVTLAVTFVALPLAGWVLITAINTEFANLPRTHKTAVIATVAVFLVVGFLFGARNDLVLTCDDFKVSGNDLPPNCVSETTTTSAG
ncbi:MAG: hypothetical protein QNJ71_10185 [Acidimicrobiia bacterium]|nr:hypothetical protein [Acidimicrobiia bacterium]